MLELDLQGLDRDQSYSLELELCSECIDILHLLYSNPFAEDREQNVFFRISILGICADKITILVIWNKEFSVALNAEMFSVKGTGLRVSNSSLEWIWGDVRLQTQGEFIGFTGMDSCIFAWAWIFIIIDARWYVDITLLHYHLNHEARQWWLGVAPWASLRMSSRTRTASSLHLYHLHLI